MNQNLSLLNFKTAFSHKQVARQLGCSDDSIKTKNLDQAKNNLCFLRKVIPGTPEKIILKKKSCAYLQEYR